MAVSNPMLDKAKPVRVDIWRSVTRGRMVEVRINASDAIGYANWSIRRLRTLAILNALVGMLTLLFAVATRHWLGLIGGAVFSAGAVFFLARMGTARESILLN